MTDQWPECLAKRSFTVVENSGYEGERDVRFGFSTSGAAWKWAYRHYSFDELDDMHVRVACDTPDGRTYEY